ncbi:MAG: sigma 54-interacting transcriptional regulator, partial [bacterium]
FQQRCRYCRWRCLCARQGQLTGPVCNRLYQRALWLAEKIRIELNLHKNAINPETVVADLAQKIFGNLQDHSTLIVSHSFECEDFIEKLRERHIGKLLFSNARQQEIKTICERHHGAFIEPEQLQLALTSADIILLFDENSLAKKSQKEITRMIGERKKAPLLWVALAPQKKKALDLSHFSNLYYYDREDLANIVAANLKEYHKTHSLVEQLIDKEIEDFINWVHAKERYRFGNIIGKSQAMQEILELIARIAQTDSSVLIDGESGTGKELVAREIHQQSGRAQKPFIIVNCGAIPENLLESELFGHVRGAFTGATSSKKGLFEEANAGTIFLDEIGETSLATQVKLLRFLQEGEIKPVGSTQIMKLDVRVITATNRNLEKMIAEGHFRQDLYYRLNVIQITVPALRDRREDILPLSEFFIRKYAKKINKTVYGLDAEVEKALIAHDWQGNIRELENAIERGVALTAGNILTKDDLPPSILNGHPATPHQVTANLTLKELEKQHISAALQEHNWNYDLVTQLLGIGRTTLWRKMKEYKISPTPTTSE